MVAGLRAWMLACALAAAMLGGATGTARLTAQQLAARLSGRVTTADGRPAAGVQLVLVDGIQRALTTADGRYELLDIPAGPHRIEFQLIGHRTTSVAIDFVSGGTVQHDLQLEAQPIPLAEVEVRAIAAPATRLSPQLQGFYERRERGSGHFFTHEEIARMQARQFTDILRRIPGARLQATSSPNGVGYELQLGRTSGLSRSCPVLYYMNGTALPMGRDYDINNYVFLEDVAGVEVYTGTSRVPSQFSSGPQNSRCGVVVIWTLNGTGGRPGS